MIALISGEMPLASAISMSAPDSTSKRVSARLPCRVAYNSGVFAPAITQFRQASTPVRSSCAGSRVASGRRCRETHARRVPDARDVAWSPEAALHREAAPPLQRICTRAAGRAQGPLGRSVVADRREDNTRMCLRFGPPGPRRRTASRPEVLTKQWFRRFAAHPARLTPRSRLLASIIPKRF